MLNLLPRWITQYFRPQGFSFGGGDETTSNSGRTTTMPIPVQLPDYPEAEGARVNWWGTLQDWQKQPGYGAIQPNWDDIWKNASDKVQRYYMGGPEGPGAIGTVRANLARRGMSEQPGAESAISRLGMQQGNELKDIATTQATQEAALSESGRNTWLQSLMGLANLKPSFMQGSDTFTTGVTSKTGGGDSPMTALASGLAGSAGQGGGIMDMLGGMMGGGGGSTTTGGGGNDMLSSIMSMIGGGESGGGGGGGLDIGSVMSMFDGGGDEGSISFGGGSGSGSGEAGGGGWMNSIMGMMGNSGGSSGGGMGGGAGWGSVGMSALSNIADIFNDDPDRPNQGGVLTDDSDWWGSLIKLAATAVGSYFGGPAGGSAGNMLADIFV